jgi:hypothetical protein
MTLLLGTVILCGLLITVGREDTSSRKSVQLNPVLPAGAEKFTFSDTVRIRTVPSTQAAGVAGRVGNVAGFTKPSHTGVEVIGEVKNDLAFSVIFENSHAQLWFAPELLEFANHAPGVDSQIGKNR